MRKKVALIGGSFDPIHEGHLAMARAALEQLGVDEVWFIPSSSTPLKDRPLTSAAHRLAMVKLACAQDPRFKISTVDLERNGTSYTVDTLKILTTRFPECDFTWIIGADQAAQFEKWKEPDTLMSLARFAAVARDFQQPVNSKYTFDTIEMDSVPVSSTEIRQGNKLNYLPDDVLHYILDNELYLPFWVKARMSPHRFAHSASVARLCRQMAEAHGLDAHKAWLAGMFHDVAKDMPKSQMEKWMKAINPAGLKEHQAVWHGYVGAEVARRIFKIEDPVIVNAIYNHVKGSSYDPYAMIVFAADKLDPLRGYDSQGMTKACLHDLYNGFMLVKRQNKEFLEKEQKKRAALLPAVAPETKSEELFSVC